MAKITKEKIEVGMRVRIRREEMDLTQEQLAKMCGFKSRSSITKIEKGTANVTLQKLNTIAKCLDVDIGWLTGQDPTKVDEISTMLKKLTPQELETVLTMVKGLVNSHYEED